MIVVKYALQHLIPIDFSIFSIGVSTFCKYHQAALDRW